MIDPIIETIKGKCSSFGGRHDEGMCKDTGLSLYEPWEADLRADLFWPAHPQFCLEPTWKRLKTEAFYIALLFDKEKYRFWERPTRKVLQKMKFMVRNEVTGIGAEAWLVDRGPAKSTGRLVDCSPGLLRFLGAETDDELIVSPIN